MNTEDALEQLLSDLELPASPPLPKSPIPVGTRVRMTPDLKRRLREVQRGGIHSRPHVKEFGRCVGVVVGLTDYNNCRPGQPGYDLQKLGPEVDVRWLPSRLRYAYHPNDLTRLSRP